jgi:hypothetical protein
MVTIDTFNNLSMDEKAWQIWNNATFIHVHEDNTYRYNLFFINTYYVEIWYDIANNDIEKIRAFYTDAILNSYLESIDISHLIN